MARRESLGSFLILTGMLMVLAAVIGGTDRQAEAAGLPRWAQSLIRLHVVGHSDADLDQAVKRAVRDAILNSVTPLFTDLSSTANAEAAIERALPLIEAAAAQVVAEYGLGYGVRAEIGDHAFPGKAYGSVFLPAGEYRALRILLGDAAGANWWCVLFPPICFLDWSAGVVLEPEPRGEGARTVTVTRRQAAEIAGEERLAKAPVKARSAVVEWVKERISAREAIPR